MTKLPYFEGRVSGSCSGWRSKARHLSSAAASVQPTELVASSPGSTAAMYSCCNLTAPLSAGVQASFGCGRLSCAGLSSAAWRSNTWWSASPGAYHRPPSAHHPHTKTAASHGKVRREQQGSLPTQLGACQHGWYQLEQVPGETVRRAAWWQRRRAALALRRSCSTGWSRAARPPGRTPRHPPPPVPPAPPIPAIPPLPRLNPVVPSLPACTGSRSS